MTDRHPRPLPGPAASTAPETRNTSQDDAPEQAQTLADEALGNDPAPDAGDSDRAPASGTDIADDAGSVPDLVDHMNQMVTGGRIDMGAYRGERNDDDVEGALGPQGEEDEGPRGAE